MSIKSSEQGGPGGASLPPQIAAAQNFLVRLTRSQVNITLADGTCVSALNYYRGHIGRLSGVVIALCADVGRSRSAREGQDENGDLAWAFPLDDYVVMVSSGQAEKWEREYEAQLRAMLAKIATITNGEAVLFDELGTLAHTSLPNGKASPNAGSRHEELAQLLRSGLPEISRSRWIPGATAVRLPISRTIGLAFNNALSIQVGREIATEGTQTRSRYTFDNMIGQSPEIHKVRKFGELAAASRAHVLINGASGTGKELLSQAIHNASSRSGEAFVSVNCGALTPSLIESLLFGYVDGAFTGAKKGGQVGLFERANRGTLLLDEISELDIDLQVKLLRVIQEEEVVPVGAHMPKKIDVRLICTSNRDLRSMVDEGTFRHDLFYRLNVLDIEVPSLAERQSDIPLLVDYLLPRIAAHHQRPTPELSPQAFDALCAHPWPGNIRELHNVLERGVTVCENGIIDVQDLPAALSASRSHAATSVAPLDQWLSDARRRAASAALEAARGNKSEAARMLGISNTTFWRLYQR